ncbi:MAG TPA: PHP domain-containing protein [Oceanospirillales bacterium]|nr:PHP domain-containing protein [Oceanospirillales bacterium]
MLIDLHCHTTCSDGELTPQQLLQLAEKQNIEVLAITDHDNIQAYAELKQISTTIKIITGVEFSTRWNKIGIHVVGLNFDITAKSIQQAVNYQQNARQQRAKLISQKLEKIGLKNAYAQLINKNPNRQIGRPDFAYLLIEQGICQDFKQAFKKYLGAGKIGDIKSNWLSFTEVIQSITQAGGDAIIAHPLYYNMTNSKLKRLLRDFKQAGGVGLEVINGYQNSDKTTYLCQLCQKYKLKASIGSDFHRMTNYSRLGIDTQILPNTVKQIFA